MINIRLRSISHIMRNSFKIPNYILTYCIWLIICFTTLLIVPPILDTLYSGGEAKGLTFTSYLIQYFLYSLIIISIFFISCYKHWNVKYLLINTCILTFSSYEIASQFYHKKAQLEGYDTSSDTAVLGKDTLVTQKEYYMSTSLTKIRSIKYWRNHKPDSIWTTYDAKGNVVNRVIF